MRLHRVIAIVVRHSYEARRSMDRVTDTVFWPVIDVLLWGFMTVYLAKRGESKIGAIGFLLGGAILWGLFRSFQRDMAIGFLGEVWSRNFVGLFSTPLSIPEYMAGLVVINLAKAVAGMFVAGIAAWMFYVYNIFPELPLLIPYMGVLLIFGLAVGIFVTALLVRYTTRLQSLTWTITGLLVPFSCVFYPINALPAALRPIALMLPTTQAFEGMREALARGAISPERLTVGFALDAVYLVLALVAFLNLFRAAVARGLLVKVG
jgi:ABC-2 type transport system permease protein